MHLALGLIASTTVLVGCKPSTANTQLRKENQQLRTRVEQLTREREGDAARIRALEGPTTHTVVTEDLIQKLYTAHGLSFGKLTGTYKDNDGDGDDTGIVVHVIPTDQDGQGIKAAGSFLVALFDLSKPDKPLIGKREVPLEEAKANWNGHAMLFNYVLKVPFQTPPKSKDVLVRVEFTDELTGRKILGEKHVKLNP